MNYDSSKSIFDGEQQYIAQTQKIPYYPVAFEYGEGALLYDFEGNEYIDFLASASSANTGHGNKEIADAVYEQMKKMSQYTMAYFNSKAPIELAEKLAEITPIEGELVTLFSATGSASIDAAIKVARRYTGRTKLISMYESYHGSTYGAMSISALSPNMRRGMGPLIPEVYHFHYPTKDKPWEECIAEMEFAFDKYLPPEEVAAIFIEPVAGDAGMIVPPTEWVQALRDICDKHGILLVSDEIQQGLGRAGKWAAIEHFDVEADLIIYGKSLGGGLPMGALVGKKEVINALAAPAHLFTLAGNAAGSVAALKNLEILEEMDANKTSLEKGEYLREKLEVLKEKYDIIGEIRGFGLSLGVDIIDPETGEADDNATTRICYRSIETGLLMIFLNGNALRMQPPLVITYEQLDKAVDILESAIKAYLAGEIGDEVFEHTKGW